MLRIFLIIIGLFSVSLAATPLTDGQLTNTTTTEPLAEPNTQTTPLRIAVASNFAPVLEKILPLFISETAIKTQIISASSGTLFLQIKHGAPFDIFLSADNIRPQKLLDDNLAVANSLQIYAIGQLAFWSANNHFSPSNNASSPLTFLSPLATSTDRFAMANPELAPYGKAAKETLEHLALWENVKNKVVMGININQTFQQVRSKAVNSGLVALSQLKLNNLEGVTIPTSYHQAIEQQLVIIKSSTNVAQAQQFSAFLLKESTQALISEYGYQAIGQKNIQNKTDREVSAH